MISSKVFLIGLVLALIGVIAIEAVTCPIDNFTMSWTGRSKTDSGKMLHEYKCPSGHVTWVVQQ